MDMLYASLRRSGMERALQRTLNDLVSNVQLKFAADERRPILSEYPFGQRARDRGNTITVVN